MRVARAGHSQIRGIKWNNRLRGFAATRFIVHTFGANESFPVQTKGGEGFRRKKIPLGR